ncbi:helicase associated domain-containing protein [Streptomyces sp. NPDC050842]|uniref:helicase associated domain-containing protein n=1 Tax=Streptomyces sp. NPDC050842 TaxID=3365636 RepID=UPI00379F2FA3
MTDRHGVAGASLRDGGAPLCTPCLGAGCLSVGLPRLGEDVRSYQAGEVTAYADTWPLDWQRHYRVLADLVDADGHLPPIEPGVVFDGDDIGRWLQRQKKPATWKLLSTEQQERLTALGIQAPAPPPLRPRRRAARRKGAEQGAAGVPARPGSPHAVGRTGRCRTGGATWPR